MWSVLFVVILTVLAQVGAFRISQNAVQRISRHEMRMEYIPDGLSKKQWEQIKKKEEEEQKLKGDMSAMGAKRFKSRSMEAWQKSGGKHLFPVDPTEVPYEERPYMQRRGGDWEGKDLQNMGLSGKGQGQPYQRVDADEVYEKAKAAGKLDSFSIFGGMPLPWTSEQANKISNSGPTPKPAKGETATAGKKLSEEEMKRLKATLFKPVSTNGGKATTSTSASSKSTTAQQSSPAPAAEKKKGLFGLF